jgi:RHS repeat-associated protein
MVGTLLQGVTQPAVAADTTEGQGALTTFEKPVPGSAVKVKPRPLTKGPRTPEAVPDTAWPPAATAVVDLPNATDKRAARTPIRAQGLPLALDTADRYTGTPARGKVEARILDRKTTQKAGVDGLLFTLRAQDTQAKTTPGGVQTKLDYSSFAGAFGGGYASRLTLVELPACALTTPATPACRTAQPVNTVNDPEAKTLTAQNVVLSATAPTVLAAVAAAESENGDYKATPLSPSATWSTNLNTGDFSWSYSMPVPDVPGSLTPSIGLGYSSGSIDGRTGNSNNQASWAGDGFDLWPGYIERRYKPCADDGVENTDGMKPGDLCWAYDNAYVSFNGKAGELVPTGTNSWKLKNDDGTKIDRGYGASTNVRDNGAHNDEYWRITTPDGTRYYFGYNRLPGWASGKETTDSVWTAPVFGDDTGEACHAATFADSWCQQGWRWNLDYAVDVHGNAIAYYYDKETNSYGRNLKAEDNTPYTRGGTLDRIEYGLKSSAVYSAKALGKADFTSEERCLPDSQTTCSNIGTDAAYWYDTPWDLNCDTSEDCDQGRLSPAFFTRKRLTQVTTQVWDGSTYANVDSWKLTHRWGMADTDYQLLLDSVQHTGYSRDPVTTITLPKTTFAYTQRENRLDKTGDGYAPFIKNRLSTIADESGGQIDVDYSAPACSWTALPTPQTNTTRCFPQYIGGSATADPEQQWFNKYVVASVTATDRTGGAPDQVTTYSYLGGAAWHYDDDNGLTKEKFKTWSQWRGYGQVRVQTGGLGGASAMKSQQDTYFLRGMDGDRKDPTGGTKSATITLGQGEGDPITDHESSAGFAYKSVSYSGPGGKVLAKTVNRPWHHQTATKERPWGTVTANFTGTASSRTWTSLDDGAGTQWRTTSAATTYDTVAGRITQVDDNGDDSTTSDNTCTRTTYATNATSNILTLPARVESVAAACGATPSRPADVVSDIRSAYDGGAYGMAPTKGDATATALLKKYDGTTAVYLESGATYDAYGRVLTSTDLTADVQVTAAGAVTRTARSDGRTTTTVRTPATGFPTTTKTTTPPANAADTTTVQTSTTTHEILRGLPLTQTDTNGKVTNFAYDALGRSTKVWLPDRLTGQTPTYEFTYTTTEGKPVTVGTKTIGNNGAQDTSYALYDGFLRPRQTQEPGPDGGSLLTDTFYDERGLPTLQFATYYSEAAPSTVLTKPKDALLVETQNRSTYDGLGRPVETKQIAGNSDGGTVLGTTKTIYGGDRVTTIPPVGGTATTVLTDARGHTTELRQHHTRSATAPYDSTTYGYTARGELAKVTDPAGNSWSYTYDLLGQQTKSVDPDKGITVSDYDDRGQLTRTDDARTTTPALWYGYDNLGRQTELREGSSTGTLRAKWVYDTVTGAKGHLAESTRYNEGNAYTTKVVAYDRLYRPQRTSVTIPPAEGALQGTYLNVTSYNVSGTVQSIGYPQAGALAATAVTPTYEDGTLRPIAIASSQGLNATTTYSLTGKPFTYEVSNGASKKIKATNTYEWGTRRLATSSVDRQDVDGVDQHNTYRYDEAGNVLSVSDVSRSGTDNQCFTYDGLRRLTQAWTQTTTDCATTPTGSVLGGPAPYWHSYTYDKAGNRQTETLHDPTGNTAKDTKRAYEYPGAPNNQPHTLTSVTTTGPTGTAKDTFTYDETGNTATRTLSGDTQKLTWDVEGHLAKVAEPVEGNTDKVTEYLYDTEGNRLIARTPTETTLYLGATEITLAKGTTTPEATRYFDLGGGHQAVQQNDGSVSITLADHHGTAQLAVDTATQKLTQRRSLPFGGTRGTEPAGWPGTKGFVGGTDDTKNTGLTHLGAREYDPSTGRFLSIDPLLEIDEPQTLNGYTYAAQNPLFFTDPWGLGLACGPGFDLGCGTGVQTRGDGSLSNEGNPTGGGIIVRKNKAGGSAEAEPVSVRKYGKSITIQGVYIPTPEELVEVFPYYHENSSYQQNLELWARSKCVGTTAFCTAMGKLGWFGGDPEIDILEVLGVRNYLECMKGNGCKAAATDAAIAAGTAAAGKILKVSAKLFKQILKKGDSVAVDCLIAGVHSFTAGTEVLMADGTTKSIEDVEVGDEVTVTDPKTGETSVRGVVGTIVTEDDKHFVDISMATGDGVASLVATTTHPFWSISEDRWVDAGELEPGMTIRSADGTAVPVIGTRDFTQRQRTYDLTIDGVHAYYVLAGDTPVLAHNNNGCILPTPSVSDPKLQNLVDDLYKGTTNSARTGDGTTMSAIREELKSGQLVHGRNHVAKGNQYAKALNKWISRNYRSGDPRDLIIARSLLTDLKSALAGN